MSYYMDAWDNMRKYRIKICCERLSNEEEISKQNDHWDCYGDGVYQVRNISFCPFCGSKLP